MSSQPRGVLTGVRGDMEGVAGEPTIEALFRADFARLVRALAVSDGVEEAADAVQDAFIEANQRWAKVSRLDDPAGWVRRVAVNRLANRRRDQRRRAEIVATIVPVETSSLGDADLELLDALRVLPTQQRRAVCLHHVAGYAIAEIAVILDIAQGTVKSNLHDARARLKTELGVD